MLDNLTLAWPRTRPTRVEAPTVHTTLILAVSAGPLALLIVGVVALLWLIGAYNRLIAARMSCTGAWSQVDVQLKRRHDLIPNLVETVRGYASHERETLERVITARNQAATAAGPAQAAVAEGMLSGALRQLFALAEAYPDLKAAGNFRQLQEELATTENGIASSRQDYNAAVTRYNSAIHMFPTLIAARMFGFQPAEFFQVQSFAEREAPRVSF